MPDKERKYLFPWICTAIGALFWAEGFEVVDTCPICGPQPPDEDGETSAFETGHCKRKFAESFFEDERARKI